MNRRHVPLLAGVLGTVLACQVVLGIVLFADDPPVRKTTMVSPLHLPDGKLLSARVATLTEQAAGHGADRLIIVVDLCTVGLSQQPCRQEVPPARESEDQHGKQGPGGAVGKAPPPNATPTKPPTKPTDTGTGAPEVQLVIDPGGHLAVEAAQPSDTRVLDADGREVRSGVSEDGPGALLFVWGAGLVGVIGTGGWTLVAATRTRPSRVVVPEPPPGGRRPSGPTRPASPDDPTTIGDSTTIDDPTTINDTAGSAALVEVFLQHTPRERRRAREPQCPRCGSFGADSARRASTSEDNRHRCRYCGFDWATTRGVPWPNVVINPRAGQ